MTGFAIKVLVCPAVIFLADLFLAGIYYPFSYQPLLIGLIFTIVAHLREIAFLRRGTFWLNNLLDFVSAFFILYFSPSLFAQSQVTWLGGIVTAFILAISESLQHLILIQGKKLRKE